jgi:hypothetical protein
MNNLQAALLSLFIGGILYFIWYLTAIHAI